MKIIVFTFLLLCSTASIAAPRMSHHGDWVAKCHPPMFFEEKPVKESHVGSFQAFEFYASKNTDIETLKVSVNNQPIDVSIEQRPSDRYRITGTLPEPLTEGKAWFRVTSESMDGCQGLRTWNVFIEN